jgi:hypothetical protein
VGLLVAGDLDVPGRVAVQDSFLDCEIEGARKVVRRWFIAEADCGRPLLFLVAAISANMVRRSGASRSLRR